MATPAASGAPPPAPFSGRRRRWFDRAPGPPWRSGTDRVLTGVAGGIAEWLGVSSLWVRVVLAFALVGSGFGPVLYVLAAVVLPVSGRDVEPQDRSIRWPTGRDGERAVFALLVAVGVSLLQHAANNAVGGGLGVPAAVAAAGLSLAWARSDEERRTFWQRRLLRVPGDPAAPAPPRGRGWTAVRLGVGAALFVAGAAWVLSAVEPDTLAPVLGAVAATVAGLALLAGPWVAALWRDLAEERRTRIRTEERAEVAAAIHDSVLQTLALIQRNPDTPPDVARLARGQERSLRDWLFGDPTATLAAGSAPTLLGALEAAAREVEDRHGVAVEVVAVGDGAVPLDARTEALVAAAREAMGNAARHGGVDSVSVFAEVAPDAIVVFVRDRGVGFDPSAVPADRRGLASSIVGRLDRHGGTATVVSAPGEGTEVALELPR